MFQRALIQPPPLIKAITNGDIDTVRQLLDKGASLFTTDEDGFPTMDEAIYRRHENIVRLLLARGYGVHTRNRYGDTPLITAAFYGWPGKPGIEFYDQLLLLSNIG